MLGLWVVIGILRSVCFRGVGSARLHAPLWSQISTSPNWRSSCVSQKKRVRTKRAVDYGRACRRHVPDLPYPVCKRNLKNLYLVVQAGGVILDLRRPEIARRWT